MTKNQDRGDIASFLMSDPFIRLNLISGLRLAYLMGGYGRHFAKNRYKVGAVPVIYVSNYQ